MSTQAPITPVPAPAPAADIEAAEILGSSPALAPTVQPGTQPTPPPTSAPAAPLAPPAQGAPAADADRWRTLSPHLAEFESPEALARAYLDLRSEEREEEVIEDQRPVQRVPTAAVEEIPREPDAFLNQFAADPYGTVDRMIETRARQIAEQRAQTVTMETVKAFEKARSEATKQWTAAVKTNPQYAEHEEALANIIMEAPEYYARFKDPVAIAWGVLQGGKPAAAAREEGRQEGQLEVLQTQVESARAASSPGAQQRTRDDAAEILATHGATEPILRPA